MRLRFPVHKVEDAFIVLAFVDPKSTYNKYYKYQSLSDRLALGNINFSKFLFTCFFFYPFAAWFFKIQAIKSSHTLISASIFNILSSLCYLFTLKYYIIIVNTINNNSLLGLHITVFQTCIFNFILFVILILNWSRALFRKYL